MIVPDDAAAAPRPLSPTEARIAIDLAPGRNPRARAAHAAYTLGGVVPGETVPRATRAHNLVAILDAWEAAERERGILGRIALWRQARGIRRAWKWWRASAP